MGYQLRLLLILAAAQMSLLSSPLTPFPLSSLLVSLQTDLRPPLLLHQPPTICPSTLFDYSYSTHISQILLLTCPDSLLICMYPDCPTTMRQGRTQADTLARGIAGFLVRLHLTRLFLAYTATPFYQQLAQALYATAELSFTEVISLRSALTAAEMQSFVGRILKPSGSQLAALLVDEVTGQNLGSLLSQYNLTGPNFLYLLSSEAAWAAQLEGALYVTETVAENATSVQEYEAVLLATRIQQVNAGLLQELPLSPIHIVNGTPEILQNYSTFASFLSYQKPKIAVSADLEGVNFDGSKYPSGKIITRGLVIGYAEANRRFDILPGFEFEVRTATLGAMFYNASWAVSQLQRYRSSLGLVYHPFGFSSTVIQLNDLLAQQAVHVPISSTCTSSLLSNSTRFPMFLRTMSSGAASALVMLRFFQLFQWKRFAFIYSDEASQIAFYQYFLSIAAEHNMHITNNPTLRQVPLNVSNYQAQLNATLQDILASTVRIIVIAHTQSYLIVESLYDLGARAGDYMICLYYGLSYTLYNGADEAARKRRNVMRGAMMFYDRYFSGEEGARVKRLLIKADGDKYDPVSCVFYDSAMLVAHAVDFMMARGMHYEDGLKLVEVMRSTRFKGCLGVIQIEQGSNDRRAGDFSVMNLHVSGDNETLELVDAALYSPTRIQLFTLFPALTFPDNSHTSFPDIWPLHPSCPYLAKDFIDFPPGRTLILILSCLYTAIMSLLAWLIWRTYWRITPLPLTQPTELTIEDGLFILNFLIENFQLVEIGPELPTPELLKTLTIVTLIYPDMMSNSQGVFWLEEGVTMVLVGTYCVLVGVKLLDLDHRLSRCNMCEVIGDLAEWFAPLIGNTLLVPILLTFFSTFVCDRAVGNAFEDSVLSADCYEICWSGTHLRYAIASAILLCMFSCLVVFTRPLWQELHENLHLKATPAHLMSKLALQLTLLSAHISLKLYSPSGYAVLYLCTLTAYLLFSLHIKPYNYERLNLWTYIMLIGLLCYGATALAVLQIQTATDWEWAIVLGIFAVAALVGLVVQIKVKRYRSMLIRKTEDRSDIVKFAFTCGERANCYLRVFKAQFLHRGYIDSSSEINQGSGLRRVPPNASVIHTN